MLISAIKPYEKNAKKHDKKQVQQVANSIKEFGFLGGRKWLECKSCKKDFWCYRSNDKNKQFCSVKCKSTFARTDRECKNCGKQFTICRSTIEQSNASGNYCTRKCYVNKITTGLTRNKNGFRSISAKIRKTNPLCALCGTKKNIHIHHIEPYRYTQNNNLSNLIPLCRSHHKVVEHQTEQLLRIDDQERVFMMIKNILFDRYQHTNFVCK